MMSKGFTVLWLLATCGALQLSTAGAQEENSEAYSHKDFKTTLYSSYNFLKCTTDLHMSPASTQEVSYLVKLFTSSGNPIKIRATRPGFHSGAGFVCAGKRDNTKQEFKGAQSKPNPHPESITMLLHNMNKVVAVDSVHRQLTIQAGMTLLDLANAAEANDMSIRAGVFSVYANLTVGGLVSASSHGTGLGTFSSLGMLVRKITWVNGKGEIIVSDWEADAEVNALIGGLGLLGIITELTLQLEANSRTIIEAREDQNDANIAADVKHILKHETPHVIVLWSPDMQKYRVQMFTHVAAGEPLPPTAPAFHATGRYSFLQPVDDLSATMVGGLLAAWDGDIADDTAAAEMLNAGICSMEEADNRTPLFTDKDGTVLYHATVPTNYAMFGPECAPKCLWTVPHVKAFAEDMEFTIKVSQLEGWVDDVRAVIQAELQEVQARLDDRHGKGKVKRCLSPGKVWIRFGKGSSGLLATSAGTEDVAFVQWSFLVSAATPTNQGKQATMVQTIEQLSLCKYKARPHWGKNHERVFRHPKCHVRDNFPEANFDQILKLQQRHDPRKVFEPELLTHVLDKRGPDYSPLCTLHYWCYCDDDSHCPRSHACLPSPAFPDLRVCRLQVSKSTHEEL